MPPTDPRSLAALDAALTTIRSAAQSAVDRVGESLAAAAQSTSRMGERDTANAALLGLRRHAADFQRVFAQVLREKVDEELAPREDSGRTLATATWQTLSLVGDDEMEERMVADRIGQTIAHGCDAELRELAPYIGSLLAGGRAEFERNPLRAEMLGKPLYRAIAAVSQESAEKKLLGRELAEAMAKAMPLCYTAILRDLQARGIRPALLTARSVEGPGASGNSGYTTLDGSQHGELDESAAAAADSTHASGFVNRSTRLDIGTTSSSFATGALPIRPSHEPRTRHGADSGSGGGGHHGAHGNGSAERGDAQLMSLLRRLSSAVGHAGDGGGQRDPADQRMAGRPRPTGMSREAGHRDSAGRAMPAFDSSGAPLGRTSRAGALSQGARYATRFSPSEHPSTSAFAASGYAAQDSIRGDALGGLMAVNLIRAHREELLQASSGQLDHMVIDVVGSLFDQILSDARVPPQMARQIARLQLPVLRVALSDASFFSSRRHPVRRFVNRIASLACAFDEFDEGPGLHFINRVAELVQEIVAGDFDQIELYAGKLAELERFIAEQAGSDAQRNGTAVTLENKETELRLQQRYMLQLQGALSPLSLPPYLGDFLTQVWSQALVLTASHDGVNSDRAQRFRRAGRDLIMSVQPKGSPAMRQKFLMQLPPLMKDLSEGLRLVGWPEEAQRGFFAKLLPAHSASLKAAPLSELDHNMMVKRLEAIFNVALPSTATLSSADPLLPETGAAAALEQRFTPEEARQVGLIEESAVDWSGTVDIDLSADAESTSSAFSASGATTTNGGAQTDRTPLSDLHVPLLDDALIDLPLDLDVGGASTEATAGDAAPVEAPEPTRGLELMEHVKLGFAYQMHLKASWQKVRLTHVSAGRSFFVFSLGRKHQETISMTSRMLTRMCATGRMRAVESAYLMERATQRARKQLAALGTPARAQSG